MLTKDLRPGHRLQATFPRSGVKVTTPSPFGIAHGFTFGAGSLNGTGSVAQLDPVKDAQLLKWFPNSVDDDLTEDFFLLDEARSRFASSTKFARTAWTVHSVEQTDRVEEVFCAEVAEGHAFVLEDNVLPALLRLRARR